jgi:uncharacterized membrane protein YccC
MWSALEPLLPPRPDAAHWIHAVRTLIAVLGALVLQWHEPSRARLLGVTTAAFLMQCVGQGGRLYRALSQPACGLAMMGCAATGCALEPHPLAQQALIVAVAVAVFYVRHLLPDAPRFVTFIFTCTVLACATGGDGRDAARESLAVGSSLLMASACTWAFWRGQPARPVTPSTGVAPAVRAGASAAVAIALQEALGLPRAYWSVLVAVVNTAENRHELLTRIVDRVAATTIGCAAGWTLHAALGGSREAAIAVMLVAIFCSVLYYGLSQRVFLFFMTIYVAVLFTVIGAWTRDLLLVRAYETGIGVAISLAVAVVVHWVWRASEPDQDPSAATPPAR